MKLSIVNLIVNLLFTDPGSPSDSTILMMPGETRRDTLSEDEINEKIQGIKDQESPEVAVLELMRRYNFNPEALKASLAGR